MRDFEMAMLTRGWQVVVGFFVRGAVCWLTTDSGDWKDFLMLLACYRFIKTERDQHEMA